MSELFVHLDFNIEWQLLFLRVQQSKSNFVASSDLIFKNQIQNFEPEIGHYAVIV